MDKEVCAETDETPLKVSDTDVAYIAGMIDGEGSIQINPSKGGSGKRYWCLTMQVSSNNREVLDWMRGLFGGYVTSWKSKKSTQGKTSYNWRLYSSYANTVLLKVLPFLKIKREQALVALEFLPLKATSLQYKKTKGRQFIPEETVRKRNNLAKKMRDLNRLNGKSVCSIFPSGVL